MRAAVAFTITPAAVSNTYSGTITLAVTGLSSPGDTVVVQKYLDLNTNGVIDASDLLVQQFNLTDGQAGMVIGSVTNINVPGDTDTIVDQITAKLNIRADFMQVVGGNYLFKLSSPAGHFTPLTNSFTVTNFPFAQKLTGTVASNGVPVPYALVILTPGSGNNITTGNENPIGGVVANSSGAYTIPAPTGTYLLFGVKSNFVADTGAATHLVLNSSATLTTNLSLIAATRKISGNIIDVNNSSIGLPGLLVPIATQSGIVGVTFTDTNGNFAAGVTSSQWQIQNDSAALAFHGYLGLQNGPVVDTTTGSVANVTVALPKATACFYGTVKDTSGNPLSDEVAIYANDQNFYQADGYTDTNGNYVTAVVGGLGSGDPWQVSVDNSSEFQNYNFSQPAINNNGGTNVSVGQVGLVNFTAILATNYITGNVQYNGTNVSGVQVYAYATIGTNSYQVEMDTDTNGNYSLNVANGNWNVSVNCNGGTDGLDNILGSGNYQCPNSQNVNINNNNGVANFTILPANGGQLFGYVTDNVGNPVGGVAVHADDGVGDTNSGTADATGYYSINVGNGNWTVSVDCTGLGTLGFQCLGSQPVYISNDRIEQDFVVQPVTSLSYPFMTLYSFSTGNVNASSLYTNSDGASPFGGLLLIGNNLYGTTLQGGTNGSGTVFGLNTNLASLTVLHTFGFIATNRDGTYTNRDGTFLQTALISSGGMLYGVAAGGGTNGNGTVFAVNTNGTGFTTLHTFSAGTANIFGLLTNGDGANPYGSLTASGNMLYGTAEGGGTNGNGTVFAVNANGSGFTVLHTFTALDADTQTTNIDGANPNAGLILSGNTLYGATFYGGTNGNGTVFAVNTNGLGFTVLYAFTGGNDGASPYAGLNLSGNTLYGTTTYGGKFSAGTVFAVNTNGSGFTPLHSFTGGDDGAHPYAGVILSGSTLYGTAVNGGTNSNGTVFAVNTNGTDFTVLHSFTGSDDGAYPYAGVILSGSTLFGTAEGGGNAGVGTIFSVSVVPSSAPPQLNITRSASSVIISWPYPSTGWTLQTNGSLNPGTWGNYLGAIVNNTVTNVPPTGNVFFRLKQ